VLPKQKRIAIFAIESQDSTFSIYNKHIEDGCACELLFCYCDMDWGLTLSFYQEQHLSSKDSQPNIEAQGGGSKLIHFLTFNNSE
jgi:hypothetical protein